MVILRKCLNNMVIFSEKFHGPQAQTRQLLHAPFSITWFSGKWLSHPWHFLRARVHKQKSMYFSSQQNIKLVDFHVLYHCICVVERSRKGRFSANFNIDVSKNNVASCNKPVADPQGGHLLQVPPFYEQRILFFYCIWILYFTNIIHLSYPLNQCSTHLFPNILICPCKWQRFEFNVYFEGNFPI